MRRMQHESLSENIETGIDFLQLLNIDVCKHIMSFILDPVDILRASVVSHYWHQFVIANEIAKRACSKRIPGITNIVGTCIMDKNGEKIDSDMENEWKILERDQKVYASLLLVIKEAKQYYFMVTMHNEVCASSTDKYPDECILNTMYDYYYLSRSGRASYWSSKGQKNSDVPETLIYKLKNGWVLSDICIQHFKAFLQQGGPIYSAKYVWFRIGHPKSPKEFKRESRKYKYNWPLEETVDDKFVWSYVSPEFPMAQTDREQKLKLPVPVVCIDAYLQIELLGRVQRNEKDGLFYICVSYVKVHRQPLYPAFDIGRTKPDRQLILKYYPQRKNDTPTFNVQVDMFIEQMKMSHQNQEVIEQTLEDMLMHQEPNYNQYISESDDEIDGGFDF